MNSQIKRGLGRGLSSLIGEARTVVKTDKLSLSDIVPNKFQPRKDFDEDIYEDVSFVPMLPGKSEDGNDIWKKN